MELPDPIDKIEVNETPSYSPIVVPENVELPADLPSPITFVAGSILTFPSRNEDFQKLVVQETEKYTLDFDLRIPILAVRPPAEYRGISLADRNGITLRDWLRRPDGILIYDYSKPEGRELTTYIEFNLE